MASLLLIDDDEKLLGELAKRVEALVPPSEVTIDTWVPQSRDENPRDVFESKLRADTALVVTDWELTSRGLTGLFGPSIVDWSQSCLIPVGDFSRGKPGNLPKEPNLFEFRVPTEVNAAAVFIAGIYRGFVSIAKELEARPDLLDGNSPSYVLASILGVPEAESQFALYGLRLGTMSSALVERITETASGDREANTDRKRAILVYVVGHLLLNAVLRYPGPILSRRSLAAYLGIEAKEAETVEDAFVTARYDGPFQELGPFFWLSTIDDILQGFVASLPPDLETETQGELNREALELYFGKKFGRHTCPRCHGKNGGFYCPLTSKTVCIRSDCSVGSNSWIPQGATLCRIEREFYDELSPILGF
jgi:hypothetical protein